jgi:hypothetical protein
MEQVFGDAAVRRKRGRRQGEGEALAVRLVVVAAIRLFTFLTNDDGYEVVCVVD